MDRINRAVLSSFLALFLLAMVANPSRASDGAGSSWATVAPADAGFDARALERLHHDAASGSITNVHAILIERGGRLAFERYYEGPDERWGRPIGTVTFDQERLHDLRSVTKSVTTLLLGIALGDDFETALDRPILDFFPEYAQRASAGWADVRLRHVLTMTAGIQWNEMDVPYYKPENDERRLNSASDPIAHLFSRPSVSAPGERWYYNGGLTQLVAWVIARKTGQRLNRFAEERLFEPLGITHYEWLGSRVWPNELSPSAASGLRLRPRDLAKIGAVAARGGVWRGKRIVSEAWLNRSFERKVNRIRWSPSGVFGYGFMWYPGKMPGPEDVRVVRAVGWGDQRLYLFPELDLVVTVVAGNYDTPRHQSGRVIVKRVLEALTRRD